MAQPLQYVVGVMGMSAVAVPLSGFHFELVVADAVDVVVIVVVVGGPFAHHGCVQFRGVVCGGAVALSRDERVERSGHNGVVARRETSTPIHLSEHTSRVVFVVHDFTIRVSDGLHAVPAVVGVFHLERITVTFIWEHKSTIIFRYLAHLAINLSATISQNLFLLVGLRRARWRGWRFRQSRNGGAVPQENVQLTMNNVQWAGKWSWKWKDGRAWQVFFDGCKDRDF